jgi:flagellar biosynthesis protein
LADDLLPDRSPENPPDPASPVAVALGTGANMRQAPRVIAKGRGAVADQILEIAFERGIKVRSDADLAEILGAVELESEIPLEALAAVAEILSYVYRSQAALSGGDSRS